MSRIITIGALLFCTTAIPGIAAAQATIEEVIVTARRQSESLRDAPVTITAVTQRDLERFNIGTLGEIAQRVPNLTIYKASSGTNAGIFLRGIGSSSESAAFEQSVAINVDGVTSNVGRLIFGSYFDLKQVEVVKGPQSLYFGKSATAGVISLTSQDPSRDFELKAQVGHEFEYKQDSAQIVVSGPVTDQFRARLAVSYSKSDELFKSILPATPLPGTTVRSAIRNFGEDSLTGRLTLVWDPTDRISAKLKVLTSRYRSDGAIAGFENVCVNGNGRPQDSFRAGRTFTNIDDCAINGTTSVGDVNPAYLTKFPLATKQNGTPYLNDDTTFASFTVDAKLTDDLTATFVTGYVDGHQQQMETTDFTTNGTGPQGFDHYNKVFSQEVRLASKWGGRFNFLAGAYYQHAKQDFYSSQNAVNIVLSAGPDPVTGNSFDWQKNQFVTGEVFSGFLAGYVDITEDVKLTAGLRYTNEEKRGRFEIPYMHALLRAPAFLPSGSEITGLKFKDSNISPEISLKWSPSQDVTIYGAYKTGFKSGGIDNSALPSSTLTPLNPQFPGFLIFKSEKAKGGEIGLKALWWDRTLSIASSVFNYYYSNLQVQQLLAAGVFQFRTFNASEVRTRGVELEGEWVTPIPGLSARGGVYYTDTEYTKDFFDVRGDNLKGRKLALSAPYTAKATLNYQRELNAATPMIFNASVDAHYSDSYPLENRKTPLRQGSFWTLDATTSLSAGRWELALVGKNLTDELYLKTASNRVGAVAGPNGQDRVAVVSRGREILAQVKWRY